MFLQGRSTTVPPSQLRQSQWSLFATLCYLSAYTESKIGVSYDIDPIQPGDVTPSSYALPVANHDRVQIAPSLCSESSVSMLEAARLRMAPHEYSDVTLAYSLCSWLF